MTTSRTLAHRAARCAVLAVLLLVAGMTTAIPASAAPASTATPKTVSWQDSAGNTHYARALTADEIKARGLDKYVDMSRLATTTPDVSGVARNTTASTKAAKKPAGAVGALSSGCWSTWFGYGTFSGLQLWGKTDVNWCGDGTWVTYANSNCYGYDNYPTYNYEGCNNYTNYGVGWNLYRVKTQWSLCYAYIPVWGSCTARNKPWEEYQFLGSGRIEHTGGW